MLNPILQMRKLKHSSCFHRIWKLNRCVRDKSCSSVPILAKIIHLCIPQIMLPGPRLCANITVGHIGLETHYYKKYDKWAMRNAT